MIDMFRVIESYSWSVYQSWRIRACHFKTHSEWNVAFYQLQGYMLTSLNVQTNVQDMYGLAGIGNPLNSFLIEPSLPCPREGIYHKKNSYGALLFQGHEN
jgi:hypothetical protein